jgi:excisionase family DNA binding protein
LKSEENNTDNLIRLVTVNEAAKLLCVSGRTVWRMIADGQLKAVHIRGCTRVYLHSVEEYLKQSGQVVCV